VKFKSKIVHYEDSEKLATDRDRSDSRVENVTVPSA